MRGGETESKPVSLHKGGLGEPPFFDMYLSVIFHFIPVAMCFIISNDAYKNRFYSLS